jgi:parallel beta-helix repeat protein
MKRGFLVVIFVAVLMATGFLFRLQSAETAVPPPPINDRLGLGADFLEQLYNASIGLCRETSVDESETLSTSNGTIYQCYTTKTYWIASDNLLDSLALAPYNPTLSESISHICSRYYNGSYFPYQIMQGGFIPLTLHVANTYVLENASDHIIALNLYNGTIDYSTFLNYSLLGDILVYEAVNYYVQDYPFDWCKGLYMEAYNMFDGKGVADAQFQKTSQYDNMKLALLIFGAKVLKLNVNLTGLEQQLWSAQNMTAPEKGGIISVMNSSGQPVGTANGETTALTLLAYDNNTVSQIQSERKPPTKESLDVTLPAATFNQTSSMTKNVTAIPLLMNWTVTFKNTIQWQPSQNTSRVALSFSGVPSETNVSIQIIEYNNNITDLVIYNATGLLTSATNLTWSNPLTVSLANDLLNVSSPTAISFTYNLSSFRLAYITAGSTESDISTGGEVDNIVFQNSHRTWFVPDDFASIQAAINNAVDGDTVFVKTGMYYEHVVVNQTVVLVGENRATTVIDGSHSGVVVNVTRDGVGISGLTIQRSGTSWNIGGPPYGAGVYMSNVTDCNVSGNKFIQDAVGVQLEYGADGNVIANNTMTSVSLGLGTFDASWNSLVGNNITSKGRGVGLNVNSDYNVISDNIITASEWAIALHICHCNNITRNYVANGQIGIYLPDSSDNRLYNNIIVNNQQEATTTYGGFAPLFNYWNNGYPSGGNYWGDYQGTDLYSGPFQNETGSDLIGDNPYTINSINVDNYPLVKPLWYLIRGDVNYDGKVNERDLAILRQAYGSKLGDTKWNANADINSDGTASLADLVILANHYGQQIL